jgi:hypothetical protein
VPGRGNLAVLNRIHPWRFFGEIVVVILIATYMADTASTYRIALSETYWRLLHLPIDLPNKNRYCIYIQLVANWRVIPAHSGDCEGETMPRPRKTLPSGARSHILRCAEDAALQPTKICRALGLSYKVWTRILRDDEDAQALWTEAKAIERDSVVGKMYSLAMEGDVQAARFILGARHGLRENGATDGAEGRSSVVINLPASLDANTYRRLLSVEQAEAKAISHDD